MDSEARRSLDPADVCSVPHGETGNSPHDKSPQTLASQYLRQSSRGSSKNDGTLRDSMSVDSSLSGNEVLRSPSTASINTNGERPRRKKKPSTNMVYTPITLNYHGVNIYQAAAQGNLPLCVLLWGMASSKRITLMVPDFQGNNPIHFAALADTPEVVGFLIQQTRGYLTEDVRLVDSRNRMGETPLLRTMNSGTTSVIKALIDEGADPLVFDFQGNNVFTVLAKRGHLWTLNFIYQIICNIHGAQVALELMSAPDNDGHTPLEWAADAGDVNVMEFFIRKGLSPYRRDATNRTALFWAVKSGRVSAARFLVKCGCDVDLADTTGLSPLKIAAQSKNSELVAALDWRSLPKEMRAIRDAYKDAVHDSTHSYDPALSPPLVVTISGRKSSHAIELRNRSSVTNTVVFGVLVLLMWVLTLVVPFWVWAIIVACAILYHRYLDQQRQCEVSDNSRDQADQSPPSTLKALLRAPEKGLGLWLGTMTIYLVYLFCAVFDFYQGRKVDKINNTYTKGVGGFHTVNPLDLGAMSFVGQDSELFLVVCGLFLACVLLWLRLVWLCRDPGIVDTRDQNFEEIMAQSFAVAGSPPSALYCRTTLVKKPIRSKFCVRTGCVVARMDHHCAWLNTTIGYGNHRTFVLFLEAHMFLCLASLVMLIRALHRDVPLTNACNVLGILLSGEYFFVIAFASFLSVTALALLALSFEQCLNIGRNITTNERINHAHYYWMMDTDGAVCNKFDRGLVLNTLEFWRVPGFRLDYTTVFELPTPGTPRSKYTLTQENIMRYSNSSHVQLLPSSDKDPGNTAAAPGPQSPAYGDLEMGQLQNQKSERTASNTVRMLSSSSRGPPSIDFDMTKLRGDSMDSNDTAGSFT